MIKDFFLGCMIMVMVVILTACGGQQASQQDLDHGTEYDSKEENGNEQETGVDDDCVSDSKETGTDEQGIASNDIVDWSAITADGVNEELFVTKLDKESLERVAVELQTLVQEEYEEEKANPEILLTQGWTRVFHSDHYKNVIDMGDSAMMPLYWIIYKSSDSGQYEYICAAALYELSGYDFSNDDGSFKWTTSKELLELFNAEVLNEQRGDIE